MAAEFARPQPSRLQHLECSAGESYRSQIADIDELKMCLVNEWAQLNQSIINAAISQWRRHLSTCVRARGAHFEHKF